MIRPEWLAHTAPIGDRRWLVLAVIVLLLVLRHLVIRFLSRTDRRR
jgi:hypothetical protein